VLFPDKEDGGAKARMDWMRIVGEWRYNAYLLADFDPLKAERIYMQCPASHILAALISKKAYQHHE
jgi:hypothetical protein